MASYALATRTWPEHAYTLLDNAVWSVPEGVNDIHGEMKHSPGPWASVTGYRALVIADHELDTEHYGKYAKSLRIYGVRSLSNVRESGYDLEGRVSIDGRKVRGFTTSVMFQRPDGSLISVAAIYACL